jgi:UDP-GlcNAc:undecaprenyl-phosphate GlcNAc-1-phosphate transferase
MFENTFFYLSIILINLYIILKFSKISLFRINIDYPSSKRNIHKKPVASTGGLLIILNILFLFIYLILLKKETIDYLFFLGCFMVFTLGFLDDKYNLSYNNKFIFLSLIFSFYFFLDKNFRIEQLYLESINKTVNIENFSFFFTIFCLLLFSNALNMFDGINCQCVIFCIVLFSYLLTLQNQLLIFFLILIFIFLLYLNAKNLIFLGNSGSYLASFIISHQIVYFYNSKIIKSVEEIFILLMIPGIDMLRVFLHRLYNKKNPFKADKNHLHHFLLSRYGYKSTITLFSLILVFTYLILYLGLSKLIIIFSYALFYIILISYLYSQKKIRDQI